MGLFAGGDRVSVTFSGDTKELEKANRQAETGFNDLSKASQQTAQALGATSRHVDELRKQLADAQKAAREAAAAHGEFSRETQAADTKVGALSQQLANAQSGMSKIQPSAGGAGAALGTLAAAAGAAMVAITALMKVVSVATELDAIGGAANRATMSLNVLSSGQADEYVAAIGRAAGGTIPEMEAMAIASRALSFGVVENAGDMEQLTEVARALGMTMGLSTEQALSDLTTAIGRTSPMILDNLGIVVQAGEVYEIYAASIGKTADELTKAEQQQAFLQAVLQKGQPIVEKMGSAMDDSAAQTAKISANFANAKTAFGQFVAESPAMERFKELVAEASAATASLTAQLRDNQRAANDVRAAEEQVAQGFLLQAESAAEYNAMVAEASFVTDQYVHDLGRSTEAAFENLKATAEESVAIEENTAVREAQLEQIAATAAASQEFLDQMSAQSAGIMYNSDQVAAITSGYAGFANELRSSLDAIAEQSGQWTTASSAADILSGRLQGLGLDQSLLANTQLELGLASGQITQQMLDQQTAIDAVAQAYSLGVISAGEAVSVTEDLLNQQANAPAVIEEMNGKVNEAIALQEGFAQTLGEASGGIDTLAATAAKKLATLPEQFTPVITSADKARAAIAGVNGQLEALIAKGNVRIYVEIVGNVPAGAGGMDVLTHGPTMIMAGDNPGGVERVHITPISGRGQTHIPPGSGLTPAFGGSFGGGTANAFPSGGGATENVIALDGEVLARWVTESLAQNGQVIGMGIE